MTTKGAGVIALVNKQLDNISVPSYEKFVDGKTPETAIKWLMNCKLCPRYRPNPKATKKEEVKVDRVVKAFRQRIHNECKFRSIFFQGKIRPLFDESELQIELDKWFSSNKETFSSSSSSYFEQPKKRILPKIKRIHVPLVIQPLSQYRFLARIARIQKKKQEYKKYKNVSLVRQKDITQRNLVPCVKKQKILNNDDNQDKKEDHVSYLDSFLHLNKEEAQVEEEEEKQVEKKEEWVEKLQTIINKRLLAPSPPPVITRNAIWTLSPDVHKWLLKEQRRRTKNGRKKSPRLSVATGNKKKKNKAQKIVKHGEWEFALTNLYLGEWDGSPELGKWNPKIKMNELIKTGPSTKHGTGVFATQKISCGVIIGPYGGFLAHEYEVQKMYSSTIGGSCVEFDRYALSNGFGKNDYLVTGAWGPCGDFSPLKYVNAPNKGEDANVAFISALYCGVLPLVFLVAVRDILASEELLVEYGDESYWEPIEASNLAHNNIESLRNELLALCSSSSSV